MEEKTVSLYCIQFKFGVLKISLCSPAGGYLCYFKFTHTSHIFQLQDLGEKLEHYYPEQGNMEYSTPVSPMRNIYLPHVLHLVQVKLRIGHAMARNAARLYAGNEDLIDLWGCALGTLNTALELSRVSVTRVASLEAEILLNMGKVQRQLFHLGCYSPGAVVDTLLQAIRTSFANDHDLG